MHKQKLVEYNLSTLTFKQVQGRVSKVSSYYDSFLSTLSQQMKEKKVSPEKLPQTKKIYCTKRMYKTAPLLPNVSVNAPHLQIPDRQVEKGSYKTNPKLLHLVKDKPSWKMYTRITSKHQIWQVIFLNCNVGVRVMEEDLHV